MLSNYEIFKYQSYIITPIQKLVRTPRKKAQLINWINEYGEKLLITDELQDNITLDKVQNLILALKEKNQNYPRDSIDKNIILLGKLIGLNCLAEELIGLFIRYSKHYFFEEFCDLIFGYNSWLNPDNIALLLSASEHEVLSIIRPDCVLRKFGILSNDSYRHRLEMSDWVYNLLNSQINSLEDMITLLVGKPLTTSLTMDDFRYIVQREQIKHLIKKSINYNFSGVNILLYGIPGTGKTEFAKVLANEIGYPIYSIAEKDKEKIDEVASNRFNQLVLANEALKNNTNSILLFDEAEDIFSHSPFQNKSRVSKVELNRLLETNIRPTIWTTNDIIGIDEAYLRRFSYILSIETPPNQTKASIWEKKFKEYHISYNKEILETLSKEYDIPPAFIDNVVRSMFLMNGSIESLKMHLKEIELAKNGGVNNKKIGFL